MSPIPLGSGCAPKQPMAGDWTYHLACIVQSSNRGRELSNLTSTCRRTKVLKPRKVLFCMIYRCLLLKEKLSRCHVILAIDRIFYGFTDAINHAGCWQGQRELLSYVFWLIAIPGREQNRVLAFTAEGRDRKNRNRGGLCDKTARATQEGSGRKTSGEWSKLGNSKTWNDLCSYSLHDTFHHVKNTTLGPMTDLIHVL